MKAVWLGIGACIVLVAAANAQSIKACEQTIAYHVVAPESDVPPEMRAFSGVWQGSWGQLLCHVLVVEEILKDGTVHTQYVWGRSPKWGITEPGVSAWTGRIAGGVLTLRNEALGRVVHYRLVSPTELSGVYVAGQQYEGKFTKR